MSRAFPLSGNALDIIDKNRGVRQRTPLFSSIIHHQAYAPAARNAKVQGNVLVVFCILAVEPRNAALAVLNTGAIKRYADCHERRACRYVCHGHCV